MATTVTDICNRALSHLGEEPIMEGDSTSKKARSCRAWYDVTRLDLLRNHPWTFAMTKVFAALKADESRGSYPGGYKYAYIYPTDCCRLVWCSADAYLVQANCIFSNDSNMEIRYVRDFKDAPMFSASFTTVFTYALAKNLCTLLIGDASKLQFLEQKTTLELATARHINDIENDRPIPEGSIQSWTRVRF